MNPENEVNQNNQKQNGYRNWSSLQLEPNRPNSNQPNIGALSNEYNKGINTKKIHPKLSTNTVKDLFTYFKYLTVLRAYQIDPNMIEQSSDPFIDECVNITNRRNNITYRPRNVIKILNELRVGPPSPKKRRVGSPSSQSSHASSPDSDSDSSAASS
jgi:hypothetical protein